MRFSSRPPASAARRPGGWWRPRLLLLAAALASCSSVSFERETESSGTFSASGWCLTILSVDLPKSALNIARENISDANLPNTVVQEVRVVPYLGALDFLLDILCVRYARVEGTWGFSGQEARERDEYRQR
jgi:hypothetical protein